MERMLLQLNKFFFILLLLPSIAISQTIVNIEELRNEGKEGFFAGLGFSLNASRGNRDRDFYSLDLRFDYNLDDIENFMIIRKSERKSNQNVMDISQLIHIRSVFETYNQYNAEFFIQSAKNPFRLFRERNLFGTGLRMIIDDQMRFGAGVIYEEETDLDDFITNTTRLSAYFHDNFAVAENVNFNTTIYYQPGVTDFSDYKASFLMAFNFLVNNKFSISLQYDIAYDSDPITNAVEDDQGLSTKFSYSFN